MKMNKVLGKWLDAIGIGLIVASIVAPTISGEIELTSLYLLIVGTILIIGGTWLLEKP